MFAWNKKRQLPVCRTVQRPRRDLLSAYAASFQPRALCLNVYQKNVRAIRFYRREGFQIRRSGLDAATGEPDYEMLWRRE